VCFEAIGWVQERLQHVSTLFAKKVHPTPLGNFYANLIG
jgi:hypothetical protein